MSKIVPAAQTGILMPGPGGVRINQIIQELPALTYEQLESVNKAKKYALERSLKSILQKQILTNQQQQQKLLQRHQALVLMCRLYVGSISFEVREETLRALFSPFGAIKSVNMSFDPITSKHKGFAFVEYEIPEAAQLGLEHLNGIQAGGRQIKVGRPANMPQAAPVIRQIQEECKGRNRVYVANVHPDLSEQQLSELFDPFGKVRSCKLAMTPDVEQPQHRGYGFIEFETEEAATEALTMNGCDLGGQALHVCQATTPAENLSLYGTLDSEAAKASAIVSAAGNEDEDIQLKLAEEANKEQEHEIARAEPTRDNDNQSKDNGESSVPSQSDISNVLVLRNMVTADDELDDSLQLDVYEECGKHGTITQVVIHVEKKSLSSSGSDKKDAIKIFVKYKDPQGSVRARAALDGRFFAGRKVSAEHYDREKFRLSEYSH